MARKSKKSSTIVSDLLLVFKNAQLKVSVNPEEYDKETEEKLSRIVNRAADEIYIDRTYVDFKGTKYEKTFLTEDGWKNLKDLVEKTKYGRNATVEDSKLLKECYKAIVSQYSYQLLSDLGYDVQSIDVEVLDEFPFMVEFREDNVVDNYAGKWQTWKCNQ